MYCFLVPQTIARIGAVSMSRSRILEESLITPAPSKNSCHVPQCVFHFTPTGLFRLKSSREGIFLCREIEAFRPAMHSSLEYTGFRIDLRPLESNHLERAL